MTVSDFEWQAGLFDEISKLVEEASSVAICAHTSPDGDAVGSALALAELVETAWPACDVTCLLADRDVVPRTNKFLPGTERFVHVDDYAKDPDLFFGARPLRAGPPERGAPGAGALPQGRGH